MGQFNNDILNIIYRFHWILLSRNYNKEYHSKYKLEFKTMKMYLHGNCYINWRTLKLCYKDIHACIYKLGTTRKTGFLPKNYYSIHILHTKKSTDSF